MVPDVICKTEITAHPIERLDWAYYSQMKKQLPSQLQQDAGKKGSPPNIAHSTFVISAQSPPDSQQTRNGGGVGVGGGVGIAHGPTPQVPPGVKSPFNWKH